MSLTNIRQAAALAICEMELIVFPTLPDEPTLSEHRGIRNVPQSVTKNNPTTLSGVVGAIGCEKRKIKKTLASPQIPQYMPCKKWKDVAWSWKDQANNIAECLLCNKVGKYGAIQQHAKTHYLPEYSCTDCGDSWHIKGQWIQHFLYKCNVCSRTYKGLSNLNNHKRICH